VADDYLELFLKWAPGGEDPAVETWLGSRRLSSRRMKTGLLVSGDRQSVAAAFSVPVSSLKGPLELPIPEALRTHVAAIVLPGPRSYN
jgi:hypothetical protein